MNINGDKIIELVNKYKNCTLEELYENHETMGNYCCITGDIKETEVDGKIYFESDIFDLLYELDSYDNITKIIDQTENDIENDGFYEYVSFEWK